MGQLQGYHKWPLVTRLLGLGLSEEKTHARGRGDFHLDSPLATVALAKLDDHIRADGRKQASNLGRVAV